MLKKVAVSSWLLPLLLLAFATATFAQNTAKILGTVTDQTGAAVVGAKVTIKNTNLGIERTTQTNASGSYEVPALPPGSYSVQVQMTGFNTQLANNVVLEVSNNSTQNFSMKVASTGEVVTVESSAPVIEATTMTVGQTINQRTVQEIPLNGRHFVDLALLVPGTVTPPANGFLTAPLRGQGSFAFNSAGAREDAVNFMINGINLSDMVQNQVTFQPTINTVSEFKIDNSTYSAEYGRNSGSIVNIATRSGTNEYHGEFYDYLRNDFFDARNAFNRVTTSTGAPNPIAPFKRNQFGADFGGPIKKGKTYFFMSYEGLRHRQGLPTSANVLTDAQRAAVVAGGNPVSNAILGLIPRANTTIGASPVPNAFIGSATAPVNIDQGTIDINHNISDKDTLHGYYVYQADFRGEPTQGSNIPGFGDTREGHRQVFTVGETHVFNPTTVNEARIGVNRIHILFTPQNTTDPNSLGLATTLGPNEQFMPTITISDQPSLTFGDERNFPQGRGDTALEAADTLSKIYGRHSLKFGVEARDFRNNNFNGDPGALTFTTATLTAGTVTAAARTIGNVANRLNAGALDFFGMDSWKVTSKFTAELGVRYAWNMTPSEAKNRYAALLPVAGVATSTIATITEPYAQNNKNFQPRVGFAWNVLQNTVVRGGYGFQVDQPITGVVTGLTANPDFALPISVAANSLAALPGAFSGAPASIAPVFVNPNFKNANVQSWNLNVEQQVGRSLGFMVGYFGSKGTHLEIDRNLNQFATISNATTRPFQSISLGSPILGSSDPHFTPAIAAPVSLANSITERDSSGTSSYNALWVTANKKMSKGLQFNASYTWSHSIDENSRNNQGIVVQDSNNIFGSVGSSDFDARHRFVINAIYDLPFKGNRYLVNGWSIAPIISVQSGNPFNIVSSSNAFTGVANTVRPNVVGTPQVTGNPLGNWFVNPNTTFVAPAAGQLGTLGRNAFVGPGFTDVDLALFKNTKITERMNLQLRADAFDLFNHPNYAQPSGTIGSVGTIGATRFPTGDSGSSRQLQLAAKIQF